MGGMAPEGWERDSDTLYLHGSGVRIERRVYKWKEGWCLIPADLDRTVLEFAPDGKGLEQAFAAFNREALKRDAPVLTKGGQEAGEDSDEAETDDDDL